MNIEWRDKALRRAVLLSLLLLVACGYCLYQFSLAQKSAQRLAALQGQARVIQQLQARLPPGAAAREQLPERLRQSAQAYRIPIADLTESDAEMLVRLPPVPFESLLSWLAALQREHGIRVLALAVETRGAGAGRGADQPATGNGAAVDVTHANESSGIRKNHAIRHKRSGQ